MLKLFYNHAILIRCFSMAGEKESEETSLERDEADFTDLSKRPIGKPHAMLPAESEKELVEKLRVYMGEFKELVDEGYLNVSSKPTSLEPLRRILHKIEVALNTRSQVAASCGIDPSQVTRLMDTKNQKPPSLPSLKVCRIADVAGVSRYDLLLAMGYLRFQQCFWNARSNEVNRKAIRHIRYLIDQKIVELNL